ncbi:MAG: ABC transporter permease, partial [Rhodothermaceae bacterium]|nr:ABC transporter permease [Rhodothermaceae bacterium]
MLTNYLKVALRSLRKRAGHTVINVGGLALGLACCFLIVLFIQHERSYDRFHEEGERIVRLTYGSEDDAERYANSAAGFAPLLTASVPEIGQVVRVENFRSPYVGVGEGETRRLEGLLLADGGFFEVFSFPLLRGNPATVLQDKYALVLTESAAEALFGRADPMGRTVRYGDRFDLTV